MADQDLEPLLNTQQNYLTMLYGRSDSIDNRALGLLASNLAILIFIGQATLQLVWWQWLILLSPFGLSLIFVLSCLRPTKYIGMADLRQKPSYMTLARATLLLQLLADTQYAISYNEKLIRLRSVLLIRSFSFGLIGAIALLIVLIIK